jgi:hypothetical protein
MKQPRLNCKKFTTMQMVEICRPPRQWYFVLLSVHNNQVFTAQGIFLLIKLWAVVICTTGLQFIEFLYAVGVCQALFDFTHWFVGPTILLTVYLFNLKCPEKIVCTQNTKRKSQEQTQLNHSFRLTVFNKIWNGIQNYANDANVKFYENASSGSGQMVSELTGNFATFCFKRF